MSSKEVNIIMHWGIHLNTGVYLTDALAGTTPPEAASPAQNKEIRFTVKRKKE